MAAPRPSPPAVLLPCAGPVTLPGELNRTVSPHAQASLWRYLCPRVLPSQVDAALMEEFVSDFLYATGLHMSYSVIVMNPKWDPTRPKYGYR